MKNIISSIFIVMLVLSGCSEDNNNNDKNDMARFTFRLTDAPAAYDKVNIDIVGAKVIINDSIIDLEVQAGVYNLLDFVNGKDTMIVDQDVPAGQLSQIRLILGDNNSVEIGEDSFNMKTPSAQQSGLKLNVHAEFIQGVAYEYLIDFDASRSIVQTGNGKFILKPVIKVFTNSVSGALQGVVSPAKAKPIIYAISDQQDTLSTKSDTISGTFMFRGLAAGLYKLKFSPVSPYQDTTLQNILVKTSVVTKLDTLKFRSSCYFKSEMAEINRIKHII